MTRPRTAFRSLTLLLVLLLGSARPPRCRCCMPRRSRPGSPSTGRAARSTSGCPTSNQGDFFGFTGHQILLSGLVVCVLGLLFGLMTYSAVRKLPVHRSMAEVSELIYETCKAYLISRASSC